MNALNSFDKSDKEYSLDPTDNLIRFCPICQSKVKVTAGRGEVIQVDAGALEVHLLLLYVRFCLCLSVCFTHRTVLCERCWTYLYD